jgi:UDP-glucose 4-epimerase
MHVSPSYTFTGAVRPGDTEKWVANIDRLQALGFSPSISLEQGVQRTVAWYQKPIQPILRPQV